MNVIAMRVTQAKSHPNADALRVYTMEAPNHNAVQIVANLENIYEKGDIVAVALSG